MHFRRSSSSPPLPTQRVQILPAHAMRLLRSQSTLLLAALLGALFLLSACDSGSDDEGGLDGDIRVRVEAPAGTSISYTRTYVGEEDYDLDLHSEAPVGVDGERVFDLEDGHAGYAFELSVISGGPATASLLSGSDMLDTAEASQGGAVARVAAGREVDFGG